MPQPKKHASHADRQTAYRRRMEQARVRQLTEKGLPAGPAIPTMPGRARWNAALEKASVLIEATASEMQEYHDERSEPWKESGAAAEIELRIESLQEVLSSLQEIIG